MRNFAHAMKKAATIGMFDGVHRGHLCLIQQVQDVARERSLEPMVVTMDRHPRAVLTGVPMPLLTTPAERLQLLQKAGVEHIATLGFTSGMARLSALDFMRDVLRGELGVGLLVMGYDHRFGHDGLSASPAVFVRWGEQAGIEVVQARELEGGHVSSSAIRRALSQGEVQLAAGLLGRDYSLDGTVVAGRQVGRELGFPTANMAVDAGKMLPGEGVYATLLDGMPAMTNIGRRPTVDSDPHPTVETHVFGYDGNLYGRRLTLAFKGKIRDVAAFGSKEDLRRQLSADRLAAQSIISNTQ